MTRFTVLMADDHQLFRDGVAELLAKEEFCARIVQADSVAGARSAVEDQVPDVLVTDMSFPAESGLDLVRWMGERYPDTPCLCLSMHADGETLRDVISAGGRGYVTKSSGYAELVRGIERVAAGGRYLDQAMLAVVFDMVGARDADVRPVSTPSAVDAERLCGDLSLRERQIFARLVSDQSLEQIADELHISAKTVENHRSSIYRKLGVHDRLSLYQLARGCGMAE